MTTLTADLSRLQKERDIEALIEMRNIFEDSHNSLAEKMDRKLDLCQPIMSEQRSLAQIKANIELVKESIAVVLNIK